MRKLFQYTLLILSLALAASHSHADSKINDRAALGDLKVGKAVFLIDIADAKKMNFYLEVIQGTFKGMQAQGVTPDFVMVYIGPSVQYLSTSPKAEIADRHGAVLMEIESNVEKLAALGIEQEICAVATDAFGIDNNTLLSDLNLVGDGFISLIGYQAQGYHLVPVY
ncbi:DsrE family protein [Thiohalophilus sp.]|uniref:DsrE family protein n=1 Tax=Thiohalophilus sp. TaxID=3028392 RepID=UPI002ACEDE62|nr:DsrE family protein [Thiohalophilus sp.]MDZ7805346.1 DsrE family protein [Thiohalophilus sp.]